MTDMDTCSCSLQARLHQIENARSREMRLHGELVQKLECELESRRTGEAEQRLAATKLRTEICRLEAELSVANAKARQLLVQQDAQLARSAKREEEVKAQREESERRLQVAREKSEKLFEEKLQLNAELLTTRKLLENVQRDNEVLSVKIEDYCAHARNQTTENEKLSVRLACSQHEVESAALRYHQLHNDLVAAQEQHREMQVRQQELERDVSHALLTRNRALRWRHARLEMWKRQSLSHGTFLAWKSISVHTKLCSARNIAQHNENTRHRLQHAKQELHKRCLDMRGHLGIARQACTVEVKRLQSMCSEICRADLPKMQVHLQKQLEKIGARRERLDMSRQDIEQRAQLMEQEHKDVILRCQLEQDKVFQALHAERQRGLRRRAFSGWKEIYLRAVVGQATHTAMIFKAQQSTRDPESFNIDDRLRSAGMSALVRPIPNDDVRPSENDNQGRCHPVESLRSPASEVASTIDSMWQKLRRINAVGTSKGRKHRYALDLKTFTATSYCRSAEA